MPGEPRHDSVDVPEPPTIEEDDKLHVRFVELVKTARLTVPENPFCGATVIVDGPVAPEFSLRLDGLADIVKSVDDDWTTTEMLAEWERETLVPVTVTL